jgi:hypothetical protein
MFKLLVLAVSMIALAQSAAIPVTGGIIESGMDNNIMGNNFNFNFSNIRGLVSLHRKKLNFIMLEIARWTTTTMHQFSGVEGDHTVLTIRNGKKDLLNKSLKNRFLSFNRSQLEHKLLLE